uniref:Uncharacterized protein n=1 Tax=Janibacter limosus TaxID=53458 RepID=A0AC61U1Y6_9MICO|nr:hypothetical protein [Janibacter limosus]
MLRALRGHASRTRDGHRHLLQLDEQRPDDPDGDQLPVVDARPADHDLTRRVVLLHLLVRVVGVGVLDVRHPVIDLDIDLVADGDADVQPEQQHVPRRRGAAEPPGRLRRRLHPCVGAGDRASAATYGTAAAVSALFGQMPAGGPSWRRASTTEYAGSSEVTYSDGSRSLTVVVDHGRLGSGADPAVTSAVLTGSSTPTDAPSTGAPSPTTTSYADSFGQTGNGDGRT